MATILKPMIKLQNILFEKINKKDISYQLSIDYSGRTRPKVTKLNKNGMSVFYGYKVNPKDVIKSIKKLYPSIKIKHDKWSSIGTGGGVHSFLFEKFASKAQQRFMFATDPKAAKKMDSKMTKKDYEELPDKVTEGRNDIKFGEPDEKAISHMSDKKGAWKEFPISNFHNLPFPPNDSIETRKELMQIDKLKPNPEFVLKADKIKKYFIERTQDLNINVSYDLMKNVMKQTRWIIKSLKYHYNRPRPVQVAKSYGLKFHDQPLDSAMTPSYPSGHSAQGYLLAYVLGDIYPEHKMRFLKIAEEISYSRNIAKQHFLSDSLFGKKLGKELWRYYEAKTNS